MKLKKSKFGGSAGFTLIELLVAMVVFMIALGAMYSVFESSNRTASVQNEVVDAQNNLRAVIGVLARELRMVGYDGGSFLDATANSFEVDINGDGIFIIDDDARYELVGNEFERNGALLADNIDSVVFTYILDAGTETSTPTASQLSDIRRVRVEVTAVTPHYDSKRSATITVLCRNLQNDE
jgi:type IV pilus assembly protein PilW